MAFDHKISASALVFFAQTLCEIACIAGLIGLPFSEKSLFRSQLYITALVSSALGCLVAPLALVSIVRDSWYICVFSLCVGCAALITRIVDSFFWVITLLGCSAYTECNSGLTCSGAKPSAGYSYSGPRVQFTVHIFIDFALDACDIFVMLSLWNVLRMVGFRRSGGKTYTDVDNNSAPPGDDVTPGASAPDFVSSGFDHLAAPSRRAEKKQRKQSQMMISAHGDGPVSTGSQKLAGGYHAPSDMPSSQQFYPPRRFCAETDSPDTVYSA